MVRTYNKLLQLAFLGSVGLVLLGLFARPTLQSGILGLLASVLLALRFGRLLSFLKPILEKQASEQRIWCDGLPERILPLAIAVSAGVSLALELCLIRWQGTVVPLFAFYKNYGLLACFAGLGLGYALSRKSEVMPLVFTPALCAWQFVLLIVLRNLSASRLTFRVDPFREQVSMGLRNATVIEVFAVHLLLTVVFLLTALAFVPAGQLCGCLMERRSQLVSYGWNLIGSLGGVVAVFVTSFLWTPPVVWFGLCFLGLLFFFPRRPALLSGVAAMIAALMILAWPVNTLWNKVYSPYQLLEIGQGDNGLMLICAAGHYFQRVHNFSPAAMSGTTDMVMLQTRDYYELPYRLHPGRNEVAIVGAGSGNDVAAALRSGADHVDAVEIDPAIVSAGRAYHPEHPYGDTRVTPIIDDARSFFRNANKKYDVIVYGLLDSHTLLSQASSVRLDSFVYTVEGLREARARLKEDGVLSLSFCVLNRELGAKIFQMMRAAFDGKDPICIQAPYDGSILYIQSKNGDFRSPAAVFKDSKLTDASASFRNSGLKDVSLSTDDWPFFYMPRRVYPISYMLTFGMLLLVSALMYRGFLPETPHVSHLPFLFLGAGFMLVETKAITELGLTFGNTWQVIAIAISSILLMAFLGNGAVQLLKIRSPYLAYLFLFFTLAVGWWIARNGGLPSTVSGKVTTAILLASPLLFSGIVFSTLLDRGAEISSAMSMNLIGAMCGGILEYNSLYFGFQMLYLLASGLYAAALLSSLLFRKQSAESASMVPDLISASIDEG